MQLVLTENLMHDGNQYGPGDTIEVTEEQGTALVNAGVGHAGDGQTAATTQPTTAPEGTATPDPLPQAAPAAPAPQAQGQPTPADIAATLAELDNPSNQ